MNDERMYIAYALTKDTTNHYHLRATTEVETERRMREGYPEVVAHSERPEETWLQIVWSTGPVP
jgi:hypothetical protein